MAKEGPRSVCVCLLLCFCVYYCRTLIKLVCGEGDSEVNYYVSVVLRRICLCVCLLLQYLLKAFHVCVYLLLQPITAVPLVCVLITAVPI